MASVGGSTTMVINLLLLLITLLFTLSLAQRGHTVSRNSVDASPFLSVDPAAPSSGSSVHQLREVLLDEDKKMYERYSALFGLRNHGGDEAISAMVKALGANNALLRHEVAYVLGQLQNKSATDALSGVLKDVHEHPMVRHEAAEALGSIADGHSVDVNSRLDEFVPREIVTYLMDFLVYENIFEYLELKDIDTQTHIISIICHVVRSWEIGEEMRNNIIENLLRLIESDKGDLEGGDGESEGEGSDSEED
ncbi:Deoxyhypusine hydroxylase-B [Heracleum sosnowskyi]|uniref:Deoxyhypusine hydroxylase-B n=1 Tax=Heracleum sosnowskyi TaxID=360622 RepID=A0AAD8MQE6_9APIA|nr:Deoxyhypusine hydroxylase-B [Heracleum sosnowskyi]